MLTYAVQLRSRRKWGQPSEFAIPVQSYAGVDTFRVSCWVKFFAVEIPEGDSLCCPHQYFIDTVKAEQQRLREGKGTTGTVDILGQAVSVARTGTAKGGDGKKGPYYPYIVTWRGLRFEFQQFPDATGQTPNVVVYAASTPLIAKRGDWCAVWDEARYFIESVLLGRINKTAVGRLDIFTDQPGQTMADYIRLFYANCFVRRSRVMDLITEAGEVEAEVVRGYIEAARQELAVRIMAKGLRATGMYLGRSGVVCRIYDKMRELEDKEDLVKFEALKAAFWNGGVPKELCRIEFQMKTRQLREAGITDVESLRRELGNVSGWLCNAWLTVRDEGVDHRQSSRTGYHPHWCGVVDAVAARFGRQWDRRPVVRPAPCSIDQLHEQALGCITSALARGDFPGSPEELVQMVEEQWILTIHRRGKDEVFKKFKAKVMDHYARVSSAFVDLQRGDPSPPLVPRLGDGRSGPVPPGGEQGGSPDNDGDHCVPESVSVALGRLDSDPDWSYENWRVRN